MGTFGYSEEPTGHIAFATDEMIGSFVTCPENCFAQSLTVWLTNFHQAGKKVKCAIYNGDTLAFVAATEETVSPIGEGWITFNFPSPPQLFGGQSYLLLVWNTGGGNIGVIAGGLETHGGAAYNNFPANYMENWNTNRTTSIYCTYTTTPPPPQATLTITATVGGTTNPVVGSYLYTVGAMTQVTAIPATDYDFDHWELDGVNVGTANPYIVTMNADHDLLAVFAPLPPTATHLLTVNSTPIQGIPVTIERLS